MSAEEDSDREFGGDDILAAEYVLGVLPPAERQAAALRIEAEPEFSRRVDGWQAHFSPLAEAYRAVEPPASVKASIDRRLFAAQPGAATLPGAAAPATGLWASLGFWRGLAAAALAALVIVLARPYLSPPTAAPPAAGLVAALAADGTDVRYLVFLDRAKGDVGLSHVSGERAAGHDFELWMIQGDNPPVSMGVIPVGSVAHLAVSPEHRALLDAGAVLAVSLEPQGGSPTGQPTGPVVAAGDLRNI